MGNINGSKVRYVMTAEEREVRAKAKKLHADCRALRAEHDGRSWLLAWAFVRGLKYRRIEHTTRKDNKPDMLGIADLLVMLGLVPASEKKWSMSSEARTVIEAWLNDPSGAIPAPVRVKRVYVRPAVAAE